MRTRARKQAAKQVRGFSEQFGWSARILKVLQYIGLSYLAALAFSVLLIQQGKSVGISLHPLFAIFVWMAIALIALFGMMTTILREKYVDTETGAIIEPGRIGTFTRYVAVLQMVASCFSLSLLLFYVWYSAALNIRVPLASVNVPQALKFGIPGPTVDFFLLMTVSSVISLYVGWFWYEVKTGHHIHERQFTRKFWAWCYLTGTTTALFHLFFQRNAEILSVINLIDEYVRSLLS